MEKDFDEDFRMMKKLIERIFRQLWDSDLGNLSARPFVYGWSMRMGSDGSPQIADFGNAHLTHKKGLSAEREPLTDMIETDDEIFVTMELPGASKEDIDLEICRNGLIVRVEGERRYYKEVELPSDVEEDFRWTMKNGVLDVVLRKAKPRRIQIQ